MILVAMLSIFLCFAIGGRTAYAAEINLTGGSYNRSGPTVAETWIMSDYSRKKVAKLHKKLRQRDDK